MTDGSTFRRCRCRDAEGTDLGSKCPKLAKKDHGAWWARYSAPRAPDGKRRQPRIGPFPNETTAKKALRKALAELDDGAVVTQNISFGKFLDQWLAGKKKLEESTRESYRETIDLYGKPGLGHLKIVDVREHQLGRLYEAIGQINNLPEGEKPSEMLRRLLAARALSPKKLETGEKRGRLQKRPLSAARIQRIHRVLSSALGTAYRQRLISHNPAPNVELPSPRRVRPLVWTAERVARWKETATVAGPVMVWTPMIAGSFLDFTEQRGERLHTLLHLTATRGLRRGEVCGARWEDTDLDGAGTLSLLERGDDEGQDKNTLKSDSSWRTVTLDATNIELLKAWRRQQRRERLAAGGAWVDSGLIFTKPDGSALRPDRVSERFAELVHMSRLPPIRFHDLRHCAATMMLTAGLDMKVISATLGHARHSFTADVYTSVVPEVATAAAEATVAIIPRRIRKK